MSQVTATGGAGLCLFYINALKGNRVRTEGHGRKLPSHVDWHVKLHAFGNYQHQTQEENVQKVKSDFRKLH